jgi:SAM-dependent methyltransferase
MSETLWELLRGATATRVTGVVAELGVADALAGGPRPITELARDVGADPDTLDRYLLALSTDGVFEQVEPGVYRNTASSELLRTGEPWNAFARLYGGVWHRAVGNLDATGAKAFDGDFWAWLAAHPEERQLFDLAMEDGKEPRAERLATLEWRDGETVVDVGGGNGSLLLELFARTPGLRGVVFDLPETVRDEAKLAAAGVSFVEGSFFDVVPVGDTYVLGTVLHNWPDAEAVTILRGICNQAPPGARVLILEWVVQPDSDPAWFALLGHALFASHERNETEWRSLLGEAGLMVDAVSDRLIQATCP